MLQLTTPIQYIKGLPEDPFHSKSLADPTNNEVGFYEMASSSLNMFDINFSPLAGKGYGIYKKRQNIHAYVMLGSGPDTGEGFDGNDDWPWSDGGDTTNQCPSGMGGINYAPTNGTKSGGDIMYFGGAYRSGSYCLDGWNWIRGAGFEK
jgi:hypothetical protein